jgi:hypothetical protein
MEENVWTDADVSKLISEQYILVSLYVDDYEKMLPDSMHYVSPFNGSLAQLLMVTNGAIFRPKFSIQIRSHNMC